ncbi:MAG: aminotransferase class V-fold PLP-dependent enzyme [Verrucomicrobiota bacterium]
MKITSLEQLADESTRLDAFPVARKKIFLGHAGVTALPRCVAEAVIDYTNTSSENDQEFGDVLRRVSDTRRVCAEMIGAKSNEIALLGPTSLGLSLFANGLPWEAGDEIICYLDDYPANVYPWKDLERHGVKIVYLKPEKPGEITPQLVEQALTSRTKLVALASCHFLTGYRIDISAIGKLTHDHGALFSLDAIQTIGAFDTSVEHVDFLSADAHKWMLGPLTAGIVMVKEAHFDLLRPTLLGAWNVRSPNFITQDEVEFEPGARRYEPGVLNCAGIFGMHAALQMIQAVGIDNVSRRLLELKSYNVSRLKERGFTIHGHETGPNASSITTFTHPSKDLEALFKHLSEHSISASFRHDRDHRAFLRISPHFYNTVTELDRLFEAIDAFPN